MKNLYEILEISPGASDEIIKAAYRVLCSRHHPDKNRGVASATQAMSAINSAYAILSDPIRRRAYDISLITGPNAGRRNRRPQKKPDPPPRATRHAVYRTRTSTGDRQYLILGSLLGVMLAVLFAILMVYEIAPLGPAAEASLKVFNGPTDPALLRMNKAEALLNGDGEPPDFVKAKAEFEAVANTKELFDGKGYAGRAAQRLGEIYAAGVHTAKDTVKAEQWFRKAAEYGRVVGPGPALAVGSYLETGTNGTRDLVQAYRWYNFAARIPFDLDKSALTRDAYNQMIDSAQRKRKEIGATFSADLMASAELSPLPPCRSFNC